MRLLVGIAAVVLALGLVEFSAACDGDDEDGETEGSGPLEEYYRDLEAAITEAGNRFVAIPPIEAEEGTSEADLRETAERFFDRLVDVFEGFQRDIEEIDPPEEVAELHDEGTEASEQFLEQARDYQERADGAESLEELFGLVLEFSASGFDVFTGFEDSCLELQQIADDDNIDVDLQCTEEE